MSPMFIMECESLMHYRCVIKLNACSIEKFKKVRDEDDTNARTDSVAGHPARTATVGVRFGGELYAKEGGASTRISIICRYPYRGVSGDRGSSPGKRIFAS